MFCNFTLADGERLTGIEAKAILIAKIDELTFCSNLNNTYGPYGSSTSKLFIFLDVLDGFWVQLEFTTSAKFNTDKKP